MSGVYEVVIMGSLFVDRC